MGLLLNILEYQTVICIKSLLNPKPFSSRSKTVPKSDLKTELTLETKPEPKPAI